MGRGWAQPTAPHYDSSEHEPEPDGVYRHTCSHTNQVPPIDYNKVNVESFGPSKSHLAIANSSASSSDEGLT